MKPTQMKNHNQINSIFHLDKEDAIELLEDIIEKCKTKYNVNLQLSNDIPLSIGESTDRIFETDKRGYIGINGLSIDDPNIKSPFKKLLKNTDTNPVPDENFIEATIVIFHEVRHLYLAQNNYENINTNDYNTTFANDPNYNNNTISNAIAMSYIAAHATDYYTSHTSTNFPMEIDAEYNGILDAHNMLCQIFPQIKPNRIDKAMIDCINNKIKNYTYVIKDKNTKLTKIIETDENGHNKIADSFKSAFSSAMKECILPEDPNKPMYERTYFTSRRDTDDEIIKTLQKKEWSSIQDQLFEAKGSQKDKMVASVIKHLHPEYSKRMPILDDLELSGEEVFGEPFPDTTQPDDTEPKL